MIRNMFNRRLVSGAGLSALGVVCFALAGLALPGCSTVEGVGKDIQYASDRTAEVLRGDR
jgi:predicted small secreted protein